MATASLVFGLCRESHLHATLGYPSLQVSPVHMGFFFSRALYLWPFAKSDELYLRNLPESVRDYHLAVAVLP